MKNFLKTIIIASAFTLSLGATAEAKEYTVKMVSDWDKGTYYFEPKNIKIKSGDTITWVNVQNDMHNAVADSAPKGAEKFESPMLEEEGQKWSYTFTNSGTYSYHCHPHAAMGMVGEVVVDSPSAPQEMEKGGDGHNHDHGAKKMDMEGIDHSKMKKGK